MVYVENVVYNILFYDRWIFFKHVQHFFPTRRVKDYYPFKRFFITRRPKWAFYSSSGKKACSSKYSLWKWARWKQQVTRSLMFPSHWLTPGSSKQHTISLGLSWISYICSFKFFRSVNTTSVLHRTGESSTYLPMPMKREEHNKLQTRA